MVHVLLASGVKPPLRHCINNKHVLLLVVASLSPQAINIFYSVWLEGGGGGGTRLLIYPITSCIHNYNSNNDKCSQLTIATHHGLQFLCVHMLVYTR